MTDIKDKNQENTYPAITPAEIGELAHEAVHSHFAKLRRPQLEMSKGEKWFNWITYKGVNYWLNLISSIIYTDWFENGLFGKRSGRDLLRIEKIAKFLEKPLLAMSVSAENASRYTKNAFTYLALSTTGAFLIFPIKWAEDRKRKIVHGLNKKMGVNQTAPDGHELTPDEIYIEEEQPTQSWIRVIGRRILGMAGVQVAGAAIDYTFGQKNTTNFVITGMDGKGGVNKVLNSGYVPGGKWLATKRAPQAWMRYSVLDSLFTAITAGTMWITNGAKKQEMPNEIGNGAPTPVDNDSIPAEPKEEEKKKFAAMAPMESHAARIANEPQPELRVGV